MGGPASKQPLVESDQPTFRIPPTANRIVTTGEQQVQAAACPPSYDLPQNPDSAAIVKAILTLANTLKLKVIAEGIETMPQFRFLRQTNCKYGQGYLFSQPLPESKLTKFL